MSLIKPNDILYSSKCLVIGDGNIGMQNQSIALALASGFNPKLIELKPKILPRIFPQFLAGKYKLPLSNKDAEIISFDPKIIFTCGRRMAGISVGLKRLFLKKNQRLVNIHIQNPNLSKSLFDLLVIPEHDQIKGYNVIKSIGSINNFSKSHILNSYKQLPSKFQNLCGNHILVLIGGNTKNQKASLTSASNLKTELLRLKKLLKSELIISLSRRTPKTIFSELEEFNVWKPKDKIANPYPGIINKAKLIIVSSDSINMISEALSTGIPVCIFDLFAPYGRKKQFISTMIKNNYIKYSSEIINNNINNKYKTLNEAKRIGKIIKKNIYNHEKLII